MKTYDVTLTRDGKWWMVAIPEIEGLTQARTIGEAHEMARDYIALALNIPTDGFDIHAHAETIGTVEHVAQLLEDIKTTRAEAERLEREAAEKSRKLATDLAAQKLPLREVGAIMNISHQRVGQLVKSGTRAG